MAYIQVPQGDKSIYHFIPHCYGNNRAGKTHYVQWDAVSVALKWPQFGAIATNWPRTKSQLNAIATIRKHDFVNQGKTSGWTPTSKLSPFLSLKLAIIAIKIQRRALEQIYSLAEGVCCKALALAALAFAKNTLVLAINLHQCSAADLYGYDITTLSLHLGVLLLRPTLTHMRVGAVTVRLSSCMWAPPWVLKKKIIILNLKAKESINLL